MIHLTVRGNPISKKNNMRIVKMGSRNGIIPSKQYKDYETMALWQLQGNRLNIDFPVNVKCLYYMQTRRKVDKTNLESCILDVLVKAGVLEDDCRDIVYATDGSRVLYDKDNPRTEIYITPIEEEAEVWKQKKCTSSMKRYLGDEKR